MDELGIKFPLEYLQAYVITIVFLLFIYMIPINSNFFLILVIIKNAFMLYEYCSV